MIKEKKWQERLPGQDRGKTQRQRVEVNKERPGLRNRSAAELTLGQERRWGWKG